MHFNGEEMVLEVRPATMEDAHLLLELWQGSARWLESKGVKQWTVDMFTLEQVKEVFDYGFELYLVYWKEEAVGTFLICWSDPVIWGDLEDNKSGYIHRFAVKRTYKGLGIGSWMLGWAEDYIRSHKRKPRLDCMEKNERLNQYYQEQGYVRKGTFVWENDWSASLYEKK